MLKKTTSLFRGVKTDIKSKYVIKDILGTGNFSEVRLGVNKDTKQEVAIKITDVKDEAEYENIKLEIEILGKLDHPNIVKLYEIFETAPTRTKPRQVYMVTELVTGGELFDHIVERGSIAETEARDIIRTMVEAIEYMHSHGVVHRDLKPENILLEHSGPNPRIKIADFGLAKLYQPDASTPSGDSDKLHTMCGTPCYVAPEILLSKKQGGYGPEVDMWSVGVIMYVLLCGFPPFYHEDQQLLFRQIVKNPLTFPSPEWDLVSSEAKDFISQCLDKTPASRLTPLEALTHPWMNVENKRISRSLDMQTLRRFQNTTVRQHFKNITSTVAAANKLQSIANNS